jgi:hypothetical protein
MGSILTSIKRMLGIEEGYKVFDPELILHINSVLLMLNQIGVGPSRGFRIEDDTATWLDFVGSRQDVDAVISFVFLRVKLLFDPPTNSFAIDSINNQIREFEFRILVQVETPVYSAEGVNENAPV